MIHLRARARGVVVRQLRHIYLGLHMQVWYIDVVSNIILASCSRNITPTHRKLSCRCAVANGRGMQIIISGGGWSCVCMYDDIIDVCMRTSCICCWISHSASRQQEFKSKPWTIFGRDTLSRWLCGHNWTEAERKVTGGATEASWLPSLASKRIPAEEKPTCKRKH